MDGKRINGLSCQQSELVKMEDEAVKIASFSKAIAMSKGGTVNQYYLKNAHGDVTGLANENGTLTQSYVYNAFGNQLNADENDANPFRYYSVIVANTTTTKPKVSTSEIATTHPKSDASSPKTR